MELSAVPCIPAVANVARHAANLRRAGVNGLMLDWTLGGYPAPNLEVVAELGAAANGTAPDPGSAMARVAERRFGKELVAHVVSAWQQYYSAPMQVGPANPLWGEPTGYHASMVGFPYSKPRKASSSKIERSDMPLRWSLAKPTETQAIDMSLRLELGAWSLRRSWDLEFGI